MPTEKCLVEIRPSGFFEKSRESSPILQRWTWLFLSFSTDQKTNNHFCTAAIDVPRSQQSFNRSVLHESEEESKAHVTSNVCHCPTESAAWMKANELKCGRSTSN